MIFSYDMLKRSWKKTVAQNSEEQNRVRFKYYLEDNLYCILNELKDGTFKPKPLRLKTIFVPKKRIVQVPTLADKIVQHTICDEYLYDIVSAVSAEQTSACLLNRGDRYASEYTMAYLKDYKGKYGTDFYVLKCDIHHYFQNIPHGRLVELVDKYVLDKEVNQIIKVYIDLTDIGIPLGLQQSQLLANLYLDTLDRYILNELGVTYYFRHMDDFYIISNSLSFLEDLLVKIEGKVHSIGLELNPKTAIFHNKFTFLGFSYRFGKDGEVMMNLDKGKRNTKHRHLKLLLRQLKDGRITADKFASSYQGWRCHALRSENCHKLVESWDSWLCCEVDKLGYELIIKDRSVRIKCHEHLPT